MDMSDVVLESQVALLTGGRDKTGRPLITFPIDSADVVDLYGGGSIVSVLRNYIDIAGGRVSVLCDLQHGWTEETIRKLTDILNELQSSRSQCIQTAYVVRPLEQAKTRALHRSLSRLEGSDRRVPLYPVETVRTHDQLYEYVDRTQLTADYGGTLPYTHTDWMVFYKAFVPITSKAAAVLEKLRNYKTEILSLHDQISNGLHDETFIQRMKGTCEDLLIRTDVVNIIESLKDNDDRLKITNDDVTSSRVHPATVSDMSTRTMELFESIQTELNDVEVAIDKAEAESALFARLTDCQHNAREVIETIELMKLEISRLPLVGQNEAEAATNRNRFITSVLEPSKAIVSCASSILQDLDPSKHSTQKSYQMALHVARQLTEALRPFTEHMNSLNEMHTRVHLFYVIFAKTKRWKAKATTFIIHHFDQPIEAIDEAIPACGGNIVVEETRLGTTTNIKSRRIDAITDCNRAHSSINNKHKHVRENKTILGVTMSGRPHSVASLKVKIPKSWTENLRRFLTKHPPPKQKHLRLINKNLPQEIDPNMRNEAEILEERTLFILAFLSRLKFKVEDVTRIHDWERLHYADDSLKVSSV